MPPLNTCLERDAMHRRRSAHTCLQSLNHQRIGPVLSMQKARRDTSLQADGHQPNRIPNSETQQAMDLQEQPEPFATAPALGSTDLRPSTNSQMSDSLLRRSLLLHRGPVLAWKWSCRRSARIWDTHDTMSQEDLPQGAQDTLPDWDALEFECRAQETNHTWA